MLKCLALGKSNTEGTLLVRPNSSKCEQLPVRDWFKNPSGEGQKVVLESQDRNGKLWQSVVMFAEKAR